MISSASSGRREVLIHGLAAGAFGFVSKASSAGQLLTAIREAGAGQPVLPDDIGPTLAVALVHRGEFGMPVLNAREREVLQAIADGESSTTIAARLNVSLATAKAHM